MTESIVVAQNYSTAGNGGRKLTRLSNGWEVAGVRNGSSPYQLYFYVSKDNGATWQLLSTFSNYQVDMHSLVSVGTNVFCLSTFTSYGQINFIKFDATTVGSTVSSTVLDAGQTSFNGVSLTINQAGTKLMGAASTKNATYASSFNIRYYEAPIDGSGNVGAWTVTQWTTSNNSLQFTNPVITVRSNGNPMVICDTNLYSTNKIILALGDNLANVSTGVYAKSYTFIHDGGAYAQSSPSSVTDKDGVIHVSWHGMDATDTTSNNIRYSKSTDGGVTWSALIKLTVGNSYQQMYPSLTVDKNNALFVLWHGADVTSNELNINQISNTGGTWNSIVKLTSNTISDKMYVSTLHDPTFAGTFGTTPPTIYQDTQAGMVKYIGEYTTITISVPQGSIGTKTNEDKNNLLTYSITTDEPMSTITEKVNGVVVGTKTATSGQSLIAGLTQEQWDAIKYGKYNDASGGLNTLTVEMGTNVWTYTFDKRLATDADITSAIKAVQDSQNTFLPAVKSKLASAVRSKSGTANDSDSWDTMVSAIANSSNKKWASGSITSSSSALSFIDSTSAGVNLYYITITGLTFQPSKVVIYRANGVPLTAIDTNQPLTNGYNLMLCNTSQFNIRLTGSANITSTGFTLPANSSNVTVNWVAIE